jgi:hypothetical protein
MRVCQLRMDGKMMTVILLSDGIDCRVNCVVKVLACDS